MKREVSRNGGTTLKEVLFKAEPDILFFFCERQIKDDDGEDGLQKKLFLCKLDLDSDILRQSQTGLRISTISQVDKKSVEANCSPPP